VDVNFFWIWQLIRVLETFDTLTYCSVLYFAAIMNEIEQAKKEIKIEGDLKKKSG
jgi:hypothetical protein